MKKILIIEDDPLLLKVYQEVLEKTGYTVLTATTGPSGMDAIIAHRPNLVLLDLMIPGGLNGFDILSDMKKRQELSAIPVIVISNLDSEKEVALEIGAVDYIFKPSSNIDEIVDTIQKYVTP